MSDFADGMPPQRYGCRRPTACGASSRWACRKDINRQREPHLEAPYRWSLDEGRWKHAESPQTSPQEPLQAPCETNPFIGFKRYVDSAWGRLATRPSFRTTGNTDSHAAKQASLRWQGETREAGEVCGTRDEAVRAARQLFRVAERRTRHLDPASIGGLFREDQSVQVPSAFADAMLAFGGACYFLPEIGDKLPSAATLFHPPSTPPSWLSIEWFKRSPYSPIEVESWDETFAAPGTWRTAFEELLTASLGDDRPHQPSDRYIQDSQRTAYSNQQSGMDWVVGLQFRGILPPLLPSLYASLANDRRDVDNDTYASNIHNKDFDRFVDEIWKTNRASSILDICHSDSKAIELNTTDGNAQTGNLNTDPCPGRVYVGTALSLDMQSSPLRPTHTFTSGASNNAAETNGNDRQEHNFVQKPISAVTYTSRTTKTTRTIDGKFVVRTTTHNRYEDGTEEEVETVHTSNNSERPF